MPPSYASVNCFPLEQNKLLHPSEITLVCFYLLTCVPNAGELTALHVGIYKRYERSYVYSEK